jgi:glycosyltransferase involved in cell wall biosynthesis
MTDPLVTVVTSSWQRATTVINHAVASVNRQTYLNTQHIVVIDGHDAATEANLREAGYTQDGNSMRRYAALGRNWSSFSGDGGFGSTCRMVGSWLAAGDLITYLDDDNDYEPQHIAEMVSLFEDPGLDFATNGPGAPPGVGRTDTSGIMHRAAVLKQGGSWFLDGYEGDGRLVERWLAAGLTWVNKPNGTFHLTNGYHRGAPLG